MFLSRCFTHRINRFRINSLFRKSEILICTKSAFCTAKLKDIESVTPSEYYHQYILSNPEKYTCCFHTLELVKEVESNTESFESLSDLFNNFEEYSDSDKLKKILASEFNCDVNEICKKIIFIGKKHKTHKNICKKLAEEISEELFEKQLSIDEVLKILTALSISRLKCYFCYSKILKCFNNISKLTPHQIVQVFLIAPNVNLSKNEQKFNILLNLNDRIPLFNADEFGIISRGLIRLNFTFNQDSIANKIILKMTENIENIHSVPLRSICLALGILGNKLNSTLVLDLQEKFTPYVSKFTIPALLELSELGIRLGYVNSSFWEATVKKYKENLSTLPPVSIIRIQKQSLIYNAEDHEFMNLIIKEFEKYVNDTENLDNLVYFLCNLSYCNLYPKYLFDKVFSNEAISETIFSYKTRTKIKVCWWILYVNVEVERPEYLNFTLNSKHRKKFYALSLTLLWNQRAVRSFTDKIESYLINLYGEKAVVKTDCLPLYFKGLVLRFNKNLEAQPIPNEFYVDRKSYAKKPLDDNHYWVFLTLLALNHAPLNNLTVFAHHSTQIRQLKALGYIPIVVPIMQYIKHENQNTKDAFITELIQNTLKEQENILKN